MFFGRENNEIGNLCIALASQKHNFTVQGTVFKRRARLKSPKSASVNERDGG